jgi:hypothetical protein
MTSITPKLTAMITTLAMLAPAAGAQAATSQTLHPARHPAASGSQRHVSPAHARRLPATFQPDTRSWS